MKRRTVTVIIAIVFVVAMFAGGTIASAGQGRSDVLDINPDDSSGPSVHNFTITNRTGEDLNFNVVNANNPSEVYKSGMGLRAGTSGQIQLPFGDHNSHDVGVVVTASSNPESGYIGLSSYTRSSNRYPVQVEYREMNTERVLGTGEVQYLSPSNNSVTFVGPETIGSSADGYARVSNLGVTKTYPDVGPAVIYYKKIVNDPIYVTIKYVDEYNQSIGGPGRQQVDYGQTLNANIDTKVTYGGKEYTLNAGQPTSISHAHSLGSQTYTVSYTSVPVKPEAFRVLYVDPNGKTLYTNTATVAGGGSTQFQTAATYTDGNGQTYARVAGEPATITHTYGSSTLYTVKYEPIKATGEYQVAVRYVNAYTGAALDTKYETVPVNQGVRHTFPRTLSVKGTEYVLASGQGNYVDHNYGEAKRVYTIAYNEQGENAPTAYDVTVRWVDINTNTVLKEEKLQSTVNGGALKIVPGANTQQFNGKDYTLVSNQAASYDHDFYSVRRIYTFYMKDPTAPDRGGQVIQNPDGTQTVVLGTGEVLTEGLTGDTEEAPQEPDEDTPIEELIPDDENPLEGPEGQNPEETVNPEEIEDNPNALSDAVKEMNEATGGWLLWGVIIAAAAIGIIVVVVFNRKKKKNNV